MKVIHDWLKEYVGDAMPDVATCEDLFTFHAFEVDGVEVVEGKDVLDIKVLPDRASDCLSHRGIAHELAAIMGAPLTHDPLREPVALVPLTEKIKVTIEDTQACRRFGAALMTGVAVKESPEWLKARLHALGQRSINNVVDATNYVMLGLGQPLHAYDAAKFPHTNDMWHFGVRMAREGEEVTTLSGDTYSLTPLVQLITDAPSGVPLGIAGIKGGKLAEIDAATTNIILEAANFAPQITRKAAQFLKLQTDASKRFENNLSPELVPYALVEVVRLITEISGGTCAGYADVYPTPFQSVPVTVSLTQVNALLGMTLTEKEVEDILTRLGFSFIKDGDAWTVTAPWGRTDVTIPADVIADIGRVYGYEHVASVLPLPMPLAECNARQYYSEIIRHVLVEAGCSEVITSSFRKKDVITLQNALASDKGSLRSTLTHNIREALDKNMPNVDLLGLTTLSLFEIGTVFNKTTMGDDVMEHISLAIGVRTKQQGYTPKDDALLASLVTHVEEVLGVMLNGVSDKGVYECNLTDALNTLPVPQTYDAYVPQEPVSFTPFSAYPFISRDIALWVPEAVTAEEIEREIREHAGTLLTRVTLFDSFTKEGRVSYAFRLIFQSHEKTLTDDEVGPIMQTLTTTLTAKGFEIR
ncbi:phenylalanine--tRNA ligase subunit beta [Candidatus Kaiserbacteria bacterium]|nr:MAG: phenylalanine--tRNA ligase subunit beta [Candidatus Kaiserbacteria bacterium]